MIRGFIFTIIVIMGFAACTDHRDLDVASLPLLLVKNDWKPSRTNLDKTELDDPEDYTDPKATVMIYPLPSPIFCLDNCRRKMFGLDQGNYHILVLNDYLYSESHSFLRYIQYRGTDQFETFEACVTTSGDVFKSRQGEVVVNNPDTLATRSTVDVTVVGQKGFHLKYKDGEHKFPAVKEHVEDSLLFIPCRVVHGCVVTVRANNIAALNGVGKVRASLRGFSGSVFLANRMPGHSNVTHQFSLNGLRVNGEVGTISARFSTFGPPLDLPERRYELEIYVLYPSGREAPPFLFDVTDQLVPQIARMNDDRLDSKPIMDDIQINVTITLENDKGDWDVGLDDWGDETIVTIPM